MKNAQQKRYQKSALNWQRVFFYLGWISSYANYTNKAKFSEVVLATSAIKTAIDVCVQDGSCISLADSTKIDLSMVAVPCVSIDGTQIGDTAGTCATMSAAGHVKSAYIETGATTDLVVLSAEGKPVSFAAAADNTGAGPLYQLNGALASGNITWLISTGATCKTMKGGAIC